MLGPFLVETLELIHDPVVDLRGGLRLYCAHDHVVRLDRVGNRVQRSILRLDWHRLIVNDPVGRVIDAGFGQIIRRIVGTDRLPC